MVDADGNGGDNTSCARRRPPNQKRLRKFFIAGIAVVVQNQDSNTVQNREDNETRYQGQLEFGFWLTRFCHDNTKFAMEIQWKKDFISFCGNLCAIFHVPKRQDAKYDDKTLESDQKQTILKSPANKSTPCPLISLSHLSFTNALSATVSMPEVSHGILVAPPSPWPVPIAQRNSTPWRT